MEKTTRLRKAVGGAKVPFQFDVKACEFLIKNLTDSSIYVTFSMDETDIEKMILIPQGSYQRYTVRDGECNLASTDTVYVAGENSGEGVEIECLKW